MNTIKKMLQLQEMNQAVLSTEGRLKNTEIGTKDTDTIGHTITTKKSTSKYEEEYTNTYQQLDAMEEKLFRRKNMGAE